MKEVGTWFGWGGRRSEKKRLRRVGDAAGWEPGPTDGASRGTRGLSRSGPQALVQPKDGANAGRRLPKTQTRIGYRDSCNGCSCAELAGGQAQLPHSTKRRTCGFISSHLTLALAQAWQAWATRPAPGEELTRRRFVPSSSWWLVRWRLRRSARENALEHICRQVRRSRDHHRRPGKTCITGKPLAKSVGCNVSLLSVSTRVSRLGWRTNLKMFRTGVSA